MRNMIVSLAACALLSAAVFAGDKDASAPVAEDAQPDATVTLKGGSVAAGIGYTWGHGEIQFQDATHRFTIKGVSLVDVGADGYTASGHVYHLKKLEDFAGNYIAAEAGIAIAGGGNALVLKNEHGVVMKLVATDIGLKFTLAGDGVHIALKK